MKKNILIKFSVLVITLVNTSVLANAQVLEDIQNRFNTYNQNTLQEKLYLHTDKSFYLAGEVIWFKAYDISEAQNKLIDASKVAYAEVLDKDNAPMLQGKIELTKGTGNGSFYLPVSLAAGNYKIRAYTNWMKNFGADKYFEKNITIVNSLKEITLQTKEPVVADYDAQFFPEGGNLVNGLNTKVAYRVVGSDGKGVDFNGAIVNRNNDTVARFRPYKFGIGTFMFKPDAANAYRAVLKIKGKSITKPLPAIATSGYAMQVSDAGAQLKVSVSTTAANGGAVYLVAHTRQSLAVAKSLNLTNGEGSFLIDKNKLGEGISHLTLFNGDKQPVAERLYLTPPTQKLTIEASADRADYLSRRNVTVAVQTKTAAKPETANLSMAVYRLDSLETANPESIYTYIWLTSELKGNIESPEYYLNGADDEALDNLLLTHGWSKYNWNEVMQAQAPVFKYLPEYDGHIITGKITDPNTSLPVKGNQVLLGVPGKRVQLYNSVSDADGNFFFNTKSFVGPNEIVVQPRLEKDTLLKAQIFNPFSEQYSATRLPDLSLPKNLYNSLAVHSLGMQVQNVYSGEKLKQQYVPLIDTTSSFNGTQKVYLLDNYVRFTTMEEVLREYVREVLVSRSNNRFRFRVINDDYLMEYNPLVLFDGVPIYNPDVIVAADPLKVRKIEVEPFQYNRGKGQEYGIISFTTYKGDLGGIEINPHALVMDYEGLQLSRDFFSPVYETPKQISSTLPDFRTLLYWSPDVDTDASGKASVNFYTSDQAGKYIGVIQGLSASGKAGMQTFSFEVKRSVAP